MKRLALAFLAGMVVDGLLWILNGWWWKWGTRVQVKSDIELIQMEITRAPIPTPYQEGKVSEKFGPHYGNRTS